MKSDLVAGVAWYRPEQWSRLREVSADRDELEATYQEWEKNAKKTLRRLRREGLEVERIDIDVEELVAWCSAGGRRIDGKARAAYASAKLREVHVDDVPPN